MRAKFLTVIALLIGGGLLSGCIIEPGYGYGYRHHHHYHYDYERY